MHYSKSKFSVGALLLILFISCAESTSDRLASISGNVVAPTENSRVWLKKRRLPKREFISLDSAQVDDSGNFEFAYEINEPGYYQVFYEDSEKRSSAPVLIDEFDQPLNIDITVDTSHFMAGGEKMKIRRLNVKGSPDNALLDKYFEINKHYYVDLIFPLKNQLKEALEEDGAENLLDSLNTLLVTYDDERFEKLNQILLDEMGTSISVFQTMSVWDPANTELIESVTARFQKEKANSFITPHIMASAENLKTKSWINRIPPNFTLLDNTGQRWEFEDIAKGKVLLLDFWASWCGPCVKEIPGWKEIKETYSGDDFEIVSISTDKNVAQWEKALQKYEMPWINLIDAKEEKVAQKYGVKLLPTNYLIGKDGKVLKKDITFVELKTFLE